jgi:anti-sigma regulatory factor (Ser/Thr protein kinase)
MSSCLWPATEENSDLKTQPESSQACEAPRFHFPRLEMLSERQDWAEFSLPCVLEAADHFSDFSVWFFTGLPEEVLEDLRTALRELVLNAIEWGGKLDESRRVRVTITRGQDAIFCRVADPGEGFNFRRLRHASIGNPEDDPCRHLRVREEMGLRAGGFGLSVVQAKVNELMYNSSGNEAVLVKYLSPLPAPEEPFCD